MNVSVPTPLFMSEPVPLITVSNLPAADWSNSSSAALAIAPGRLAAEPMSRPAEIVVPPEKELLPESVSVPPPCFVSDPVPEIAPAIARLSARLTTSEALFVMSPEPSNPLVPPLPNWSTPAEIVVLPELEWLPVIASVPVPVFTNAPEPVISPE